MSVGCLLRVSLSSRSGRMEGHVPHHHHQNSRLGKLRHIIIVPFAVQDVMCYNTRVTSNCVTTAIDKQHFPVLY